MKNKIFGLIISFVLLSSYTQAQIALELQSRGAEENTFVTIRGYEISPTDRHPYMFSSLGFYKIKIKNPAEQGFKIMVLNKEDKEIASNYNPITREYTSEFAFSCRETDIYYVICEETKQSKFNKSN